MLSSVRWRSFQWKTFWMFVPTGCVLALAIFIIILGQGSSQFLVSLLMVGLIAQAIGFLIATRASVESTASDEDDEECDESELTFSPVFHANPLPTCISTLDDGRFVGVNDAWMRFFGYSSKEAVGKTGLDLNIWVHSTERAELLRQLQTIGFARDYETPIRTQSGEIRNVLISAQVLEWNGTRYSLTLLHDITEIKAREERLNLVMRATNDGIWDWNTRTNQVYYSPRWKSMLGYTEDEIGDTNDAWLALVHPDDYERALARSREDVEGPEPEYILEHRLRHKDGSYRWILSRGVALRDASGTTYRMVGSHTDITELKRTAEALQHRLAFERLITNISTEFINLGPDEINSGIEQSLAAIGRFTGSDRSYVFLFAEDGTRLGNPHEWCRAGIESLQPLYQSQSLEMMPWTMEQIKQGKVVHVPSFCCLPPEAQTDKSCCSSHQNPTCSFINVPMLYQGQVIGLLGFDAVRAEKTWSEDTIALLRIVGEIFVSALERKRAADELRKSEARFRAMFENASIGMAITDVNDAVIQANSALSQMLGYSVEALRSLRTRDYTYPADYPAQQVLENEIAGGKRDHYKIEKRYIRKDGQIVWGRMIRSVVRDASGKLLYRLGMVEDITEQKLAAQKLAEAYQTMEHRVARRTHELATLNAISASVSRSLNLNEIMADALQRLMELTGMEHGIAYRISSDEEGTSDPEHIYLRVMASRGFPDELAHLADGAPLGKTATGVVARVGEPMMWSLADLPTHSSFQQSLASIGVRQIIIIPLMAKERFVGSLSLSTNKTRVYASEQIALLKTIGQQIGVAVENARLYEQAERSAQAAERSRLARELHDSVTQSLYSMTLYAEATARLLTAGQTEQAAGHLRDLRDTAQEALREMRLLIFELRPPALENGLATAVQARLDSVESRGGIQAELRVDGEEHLSPAMQRELYNIAMESLNNALKHASARHVQVHLKYSADAIDMKICDDGIGFDVETANQGGGFGIFGMRERVQRIGGTIEIASAPSKGTNIIIHAPLNIHETQEQTT